MRKVLLPLLCILLSTACKKEIGMDNASEEIVSSGVTASRTSPKLTICHHDAQTGENKTIEISETAWPAHQAHGDLLGSCSDVIVTICGKDWMLKNLDVTTYRNGDNIPQATTDAEWIAAGDAGTGAWCYFANNSANGTTYGKLYNWYAVNDSRGFAPTGWHVPTDVEWVTLSDCLGGNFVAGGKMKSTGTIQASTGLWNQPNAGATNSSGFTGLPGGYRYFGNLTPSGSGFFSVGSFGLWWSSTEANATDAWGRILFYNSRIFPLAQEYPKHFGYSVRCLRD